MIKHLIIDGSNFFQRAFHTKTKINKNGKNIGAIIQTVDMLNRIIKHFNPVNVIFVWDIGKSEKRLKLYPKYKGNRKKLDEAVFNDMNWQKEQIKKILETLPIRQLGVQGIEADDIIGFLLTKLKSNKVIVSNDRDFIQCIDKKVDLFLPNKGRLLTHKNVSKFLGFPLQYFVLSKAISGDKSDNISSSFPKFGEVRTRKFILEGIKNKQMNIPKEFEPIIKLNTILMTIGLLLDKDDELKIIKNYKSQYDKSLLLIELKNTLISIGMNRQARNISTIVAPYKKLIVRH